MKHVWTIAKKELRGFFGSAVAIVFLATFLGISLFSFFWVGSFFSRGIADVRPLFDYLPLLLILLVAALSMRVWSEEQRGGTIEILMTLPVPRHQLVLGKFLAGMILVALALLLTFGVPLTVSRMGNLDWGPVFGGYLAALLLAAAYLAIGMCVSAATDSQIVALISTMLVCGLLYLPGAPKVLSQFPADTGEVLRSIATGSRFESIARGVLDLRDLAYYASLVVVFLGLNVLLLSRRRWSSGPRTRRQRTNAQLAVGLAAANAIALNLWLAPVHRARIDLTQNGEYSLSPPTKKLLRSLDQPLLIRAYISEKNHPKLTPLVPRIRDLLDEYRVAAGSNVRVEQVDPGSDDKLIKEAKELYTIESIPVSFSSRTEQSVLNVFFHILISYGDHHEVLKFSDLIEVRPVGDDGVEVGLKSFEYDLTKTIKKVVEGFQSIDALFASLPGKVELTSYITPDTLPDELKAAPGFITKAIEKLKQSAGDKLEVSTVAPAGDEQMQQLFSTWGIRPYQDLLGGGKIYYLAMLVKIGDRAARIVLPRDVSENAVEEAITDALKRAAPGFTKVVGIWSPPQPPDQPPMMEGMPPQRMPPPQTFEELQRALGASYEVRDVDLAAAVPDDIDALIVAGPSGLEEAAAKSLDQYLMRGGALIVLDGRFRLDLGGRGKLAVEQVTTGLEELLDHWGVQVQPDMVLDSKSESFPIPVERDLGGGLMAREIKKLAYPYFVKVSGDGLVAGNLITSGVPEAVMHWSSPVKVTDPKAIEGAPARKVDTLLRSSGGAWLDSKTDVEPDMKANPAAGFAKPSGLGADRSGAQTLAVAISGGVSRWPAGKDQAAGSGSGSASERSVAFSPPDARLVVFGSSAFASDLVIQRLGSQLGGNAGDNNLLLVQNAVDWALADTDLLSIRARTSAAHAIDVPEAKRSRWEWINYILAFAGLGVVILVTWLRRRGVKPYDLPGGTASEAKPAAARGAKEAS